LVGTIFKEPEIFGLFFILTLQTTDFLGTDLPEMNLIKDILDEIFSEFLKDIKIKKQR
jgi:hypothetical protein